MSTSTFSASQTNLDSAPGAPCERRIIPFRPATAFGPATGGDKAANANEDANEPEEPPHPKDDAARHYLKFMLPSIPVAAFILTFVLCDVLLGLQSHALAAKVHILPPPENPSLPLAAAVIVSATTGALCMWIYFGYLRLTQRHTSVSV